MNQVAMQVMPFEAMMRMAWFKKKLADTLGVEFGDDFAAEFNKPNPMVEMHDVVLKDAALAMVTGNSIPLKVIHGKCSKIRVEFSWDSVLNDDGNIKILLMMVIW